MLAIATINTSNFSLPREYSLGNTGSGIFTDLPYTLHSIWQNVLVQRAHDECRVHVAPHSPYTDPTPMVSPLTPVDINTEETEI